MDYEAILKDIKPTIDEKQHIDDVSSRIMNFLQNACDSRNIDANVNLVGSVAKNTALKIYVNTVIIEGRSTLKPFEYFIEIAQAISKIPASNNINHLITSPIFFQYKLIIV